MHRAAPADVHRVDVDLHDFGFFGIELGVGEVGSEAEKQVAIIDRMNPRLVAQNSGHPDVEGIVRFEKLLGPGGMHHRGIQALGQGDHLVMGVAAPDSRRKA